jgi:hypothetical protein
VSALSDKLATVLPLMILAGNPGLRSSSLVYIALVTLLAATALLFIMMHTYNIKATTGMTFLKVTLYSEWLRESKVWRIVWVILTLSFFGFIVFVNSIASKGIDSSAFIYFKNVISG